MHLLQQEAAAAMMYPYTKVTWGHDNYERLEAAIRIIKPPLTAFLSTLCAKTTYKFQQAYKAELNSKLAELKVEAHQKKLAAFSAARETRKSLQAKNKLAHESVKSTIDKLQLQINQLQRAQQRQDGKLKTAKNPAPNNNTPSPATKPPRAPQNLLPQKNLPGNRGKGPSVVPKATVRGNGKNKLPPTSTKRRTLNPPCKRKSPDATPATDSLPISQQKQQRRQKQKQYK